MKSNLFYLISLMLILTCLAAAEPKMTIPVEVIDFGYAPQKSKVTCRFWIYSTGSDTLQIADVKPGCGCTKAPLEKKIVPPGDSAFVDITFNTGQYKGKTTKTVNVMAYGGLPAQRVTIDAYVLASPDSATALTIEPATLEMGGASAKREITFSIQNKTQGDVSPQLVLSPRDDIEIKLPKTIKAGRDGQGKVKLLAKTIPPGFAKSFTFAIDDSLQTRFTIPIKGETALSGAPPQKH
jgi:hypothetical protein